MKVKFETEFRGGKVRVIVEGSAVSLTWKKKGGKLLSKKTTLEMSLQAAVKGLREEEPDDGIILPSVILHGGGFYTVKWCNRHGSSTEEGPYSVEDLVQALFGGLGLGISGKKRPKK